MAFTLRVRISGLCMLVPEKANGGEPDQAHVLMPKTGHGHDPSPTGRAGQGSADDPAAAGGAGAHHVEKHVVALVYERRYEDGSSSTDLVRHDFPGSLLTFALTSPHGVDRTLDSGKVADLRKVHGRKPDKGLLRGKPSGRLEARVHLPHGGIGGYDPGPCWLYGGDEVAMSPAVEWTVRDASGTSTPDRLEVQRDGQRLVELRPDAAREIKVTVYHVPESDLPRTDWHGSEPECGDNPLHFEAYRWLLNVDSSDPNRPRYHGKKCKGSKCTYVPSQLGPLGVNPFTCMVSGAPDD